MHRLSLHLGNPAGVAWGLCEGLNQLGYKNLSVELEPQRAAFRSNLEIPMTRGTPLIARTARFIRITRLAETSRVVHFHFGFRPFARYLRKLCRAPFFVHFHGSDLREGVADGFRELAVHEFVSTPDLLQLAPQATWIPNPVALQEAAPLVPRDNPVIGHFPTNPIRKGTALIKQEVDSLRGQLDFDFRVVTGVPHTIALEEMRQCDIVIDQVAQFGSYGMVALEAMAAGKVVLSSIETKYYDRCPIVAVRPETFKSQLAWVLQNPSRWTDMGAAGRDYVLRVHSPRKVAGVLLAEYLKYAE